MKKVDEMPGLGGGTKYPWDELLDGSVWLVDPVEDFGAPSARAFQIAGYTAAMRRGMNLQTRLKPEGVYLQAVPK